MVRLIVIIVIIIIIIIIYSSRQRQSKLGKENQYAIWSIQSLRKSRSTADKNFGGPDGIQIINCPGLVSNLAQNDY